MKRFLCLTIALAFGVTTFAQRASFNPNHPKANESVQATYERPIDQIEVETPFTPPASVVQVQSPKSGMAYEETHIWTTQYDLQTNAALGSRVVMWPDGTVAATATYGVTGAPSFPDRGAAYNFYDGSSWGPLPTARVEPYRSGWPSIAPLGENGEVLASHIFNPSTPFGISVYSRETKGSGEWMLTQLPNPDGYEMSWPRIIASGPDFNTIHVVATDQGADDIPMFYNRSTDGGESWDGWIEMPGLDSEFYNWNHSADAYVFAQNGDVLALAFFSAWYDVFFLKSTDNGETWTHHVAWEHPYPTFDWDTTITTDTLYSNDNSGHVAIDNDGNVHLVWGIARVAHWEPGTTYNYWPYTEGVAYWNETMDQIPTHPTNPHHTLHPDYLWDLGMLVGWVPDVDGDGEVNIFDYDLMTYRALSMTGYPTIAIDEAGTIVVAYSSVDESRNNGEYYYRSIFVTYKDGIYGTWYYAEDNLMDSFIHLFDEGIYPTAAAHAYDNTFWLIYNADNTPGTALDDDHAYQDNQMYAVKITPTIVGLSQFVNPITNVSPAYPNPAGVGTSVNFDLSVSQATGKVAVSVFNLAGQLVSQKTENISLGMNRIIVDTEKMPAGVYFFTIEVNGYKETKKFVVR